MIDQELRQFVEQDLRYQSILDRFQHITFPGHEIAKQLYSFVFHADFEFYSHFIGRFDCQFLKPPETLLEGIAEGFGGHCLEKNPALKYLFEQADFEKVDYVFGGSIRGSNRPFNVTKAESRGICSWASGEALPQTLHCSVVLTVEGQDYLFDPNNGRMGPIITTPEETEMLLRNDDKAYYEMYNGRMYYQRIPHRFHEQILNINKGDEVFGLHMAERLGLMAKNNFDIIVTTIDNGEDALRRWWQSPYLRDVIVVGNDFEFLIGQEEALPGIDTRLALNLAEARTRINEIGLRVDGYPRYLAVRIFSRNWWEMSRLSTWAIPVEE